MRPIMFKSKSGRKLWIETQQMSRSTVARARKTRTVEILKKYHFKLPIIGNHKLNVYLKAIRDLCGIDKPIFSHVARHTYATRCLNRGIRLEVVAKLLGHSTTRITQHYAKLLKDNILNEVKDAFEKSY